jgi:hypothetical protein
LNFGIKGGTIHSILPLSFQYYYAIEICTTIFVAMKGNIRKKNGKKNEKEGEFKVKIERQSNYIRNKS